MPVARVELFLKFKVDNERSDNTINLCILIVLSDLSLSTLNFASGR